MKTLSIVGLLIGSFGLFGAEIDSFNKRYELTVDSLEYVNSYTNKLMEEAIDEANSKSKENGCEEKQLYKSLRKKFNNQYQGEFASHIIKTDSISKIEVTTRQSVFGGFTVFESPVQGGTARISDPIAKLMMVNGVRLGTDKFEHFFGSGYRYFERHFHKGNHIADSLLIGWKAETGILGSLTTGVMSYADMLANFNGMRFWNHVLQKNDDVLGPEYNNGPYVACVENQWKVTDKKIDWVNYVDHGFDEGVNCSRIKNYKMLTKVLNRIEIVKQNDPRNEYDCPILPNEIPKLMDKYGVYFDYLVNPYGMTYMRDPNLQEVYKSPLELKKIISK